MAKFSIKKLDLKSTAVRAVGVGGGAYAAVKANKIGAIQKLEPWVRGVVKMGVGALVAAAAPQMVKDKTMQAGLAGFGDGVIAIGAIEAASKFDTSLPVIAGDGDVMGNIMFDETYRPISGDGDVMGNAKSGGATVVNL